MRGNHDRNAAFRSAAFTTRHGGPSGSSAAGRGGLGSGCGGKKKTRFLSVFDHLVTASSVKLVGVSCTGSFPPVPSKLNLKSLSFIKKKLN